MDDDRNSGSPEAGILGRTRDAGTEGLGEFAFDDGDVDARPSRGPGRAGSTSRRRRRRAAAKARVRSGQAGPATRPVRLRSLRSPRPAGPAIRRTMRRREPWRLRPPSPRRQRPQTAWPAGARSAGRNARTRRGRHPAGRCPRTARRRRRSWAHRRCRSAGRVSVLARSFARVSGAPRLLDQSLRRLVEGVEESGNHAGIVDVPVLGEVGAIDAADELRQPWLGRRGAGDARGQQPAARKRRRPSPGQLSPRRRRAPDHATCTDPWRHRG